MLPIASQPRLVEVSAGFYSEPDGIHHTAAFVTEARGIELTVIHEGLAETSTCDTVYGSCTECIELQGGESVTLIARFDGEIIAAGVYQVDPDLVETIGLLLRPCCESALLLTQAAAEYLEELPRVSAAEVARVSAAEVARVSAAEVARE